MYVNLALPLPIRKLFTYGVPERLEKDIGLGHRALVQLGNRFLIGVIVEVDVSMAEVKARQMREVLSILEAYPFFSKSLLGLTKWMSEYYFASWGECLKSALPQYPDIRRKVRIKKGYPNSMEKELARLKLKLSKSSGDNLVRPSEVGLDVSPDLPSLTDFGLGSDQQEAISSILEDVKTRTYSTTLLFGNNNPRRREIQFGLASEVLKSDRQVLVILPETSLADEAFTGWQRRLNQKTAILHSRIPLKKRWEILGQIRLGGFGLVIGTRLATFAPLDNLGLIIVEEENHPSHKEEASPCYNARDVAVVRGKMERAVVVLSSRCPSLESFHNYQKGKYRICKIDESDKNKHRSRIEIVDKKRKGAKTLLSPSIIDILKREKQPAVLLLNRRGFSRSVICGDCGFVFRCPDCGIGLVFHRTDMILRCHYCNHQESGMKSCPRCGGTSFNYEGFGTQKLEEILKESIPEVTSIRLDSDVASESGNARNIISEFHQSGQQILFGTRMVLQGLDLSRVGLVIILSIDEILCFPDFRARERGFDFLSQVVAKIEEENPLARLIIQTSSPDDWVIRHAIKGNFIGFFEKEAEQRKKLFYPPFSHLISISFSGRREQEVKRLSCLLMHNLGSLIGKSEVGKTQILGPTPVSFAKRKKQSQWQAIVKTTSPVKINNLLDSLLKDEQIWTSESVKLRVEVDPLSLI